MPKEDSLAEARGGEPYPVKPIAPEGEPACDLRRCLRMRLLPPAAFFLAAVVLGNSAPAQRPSGPVLRLSGRTVRANQQEPELVPAPKQSDRFAPISELTLDTSSAPGLRPPDLAAEVFGGQPPLVLAPGLTQPWPPQAICWYGVPLHYAPIYEHHSPGAGPRGACQPTGPSPEYGTASEALVPSDIPSP